MKRQRGQSGHGVLSLLHKGSELSPGSKCRFLQSARAVTQI